MDVVIAVIFLFLGIVIYITIIRWVFRIDHIVLSLEKISQNTLEHLAIIRIIKKQNDHLIGQTTVLIEQQERMLELLEQGIELFESNTGEQN